ncbi:hypothetical protein MKW98_017163 [Papaver atlanticum]|uniref:RING-type E3 ubiquitin transferase n=1 Tax=Papaver atlanticum TaxID=357466 RepID=A0AAD4SBB9_9MAGN|nr:hypothetical protein MKW98_017163 [Papaver atlanticum]
MLSTPMISCLSSSAHAVFATSATSPDSLLLSQNCALIANIQVSVETSTGLADLLHLTWEWSTSDCKSCKNPKAPSKKHGLGGLTYLIIVVSVMAVLCIARVCTLASFRGNHPPEAEALPTIVLGESRRLRKYTDTACSICIEKYQPNETSRSFPACNHFFHAHCIDDWLLIDSRCPVCNKKSSVASETTP